MKKTSVKSVVCAAALTVACGGAGNQNEQSAAQVDETQQSGSMAAGSGGADTAHGTTGATGTAGSTGEQSGAGQSGMTQAGQSGTGQSGSTAARGGAAGDTQQFVRQAASGGLAEVQLGQLAEQRGSNDQVKQFGRMMVQEHTKSNAELKATAQTQGIEVPTQLERKHQDIVQRLQQLRGEEFDREYMRVMVDSHMEMRDLLGKRATSGGGTATGSTTGATAGGTGSTAAGTSGRTQGDATNQWAAKTLPNVQKHLQQAQQINTRLQSGGAGNTGGATGTGRTTPATGGGSGSGGAPGSGSGGSGSGTGTGSGTTPAPGGSGR